MTSLSMPGSARLVAIFLGMLSLIPLGGCKDESKNPSGPGSATQTSGGSGAARKLAISSYDPTREFYQEFNPAFENWWKQKHGQVVDAETDHGPSGKQARDIAAGKLTDVAALSVEVDIDVIAKAGLLPNDWRTKYPNDSVPYVSAVVFMVRKGNPKNVKDWEDLGRPEVTSLAPDPKTGGGARWIYLSTWCHALRKAKAAGKSDDEAEQAAREFTAKVYDDAILDPAQRGSSTRFIQQNTGDVLFGWENEILQIINDPAAAGKFEVIVPSDSITIEVPIAVVDKVAEQHGVKDVAEAFVQFHYSDEGQEMLAKRFNRPFNRTIAEKYKDKLPPLKLYRFKEHFKDWPSVMTTHFAQGAELDKMRKR